MRVPVCILCNVLWICCNKIHLEIQCWFVLTYVEVSREGLYQSCISGLLALQDFIRCFKPSLPSSAPFVAANLLFKRLGIVTICHDCIKKC